MKRAKTAAQMMAAVVGTLAPATASLVEATVVEAAPLTLAMVKVAVLLPGVTVPVGTMVVETLEFAAVSVVKAPELVLAELETEVEKSEAKTVKGLDVSKT